MQALLSLTEMRAEILAEVRKTGDTTFQGYVDSWLNREAMKIVDKYDFTELMVNWYIALSTTAPTPHTWAPAELTTIPRDMVKLMNARILDVTNTTNQPIKQIEVIPTFEFHRLLGVVNPPAAGTPSKVCLRRKEGAREHAYDPRTGATGIQVRSSTAEATALLAGVAYYADANRTDIRKAQVSTLTTTAQSLTAGVHYGIISASIDGNAAGRITFENTDADIEYAVIMPWERTAGYPVLAFDTLVADANKQLHLTYKRSPPYLSQGSDTLQPLPPQAQDVIVAWVKMRALKFNEDPDWQVAMQEATRLERELLYMYEDTLEEPHMVLDERG